MLQSESRGFTLIELLLVVAIIGIIAAVAIPGLLRSRMAANESSAIASLRAINSSQAAFANTCGNRWYGATLVVLGTAPPTGGPAFISPDLSAAASLNKSGYRIEMGGTPAPSGATASCNGGALASGYVSRASPVSAGASGVRYFWTNVSSGIYTKATAFASTNEFNGPTGDTDAVPLMR